MKRSAKLQSGSTKLRNLVRLDLSGTEVTSLSPLANLKILEQLNPVGIPVTDEEVAKLRKALPNCRISR